MRNASTFTPEILSETLVRCLRLIQPEDESIRELPEKLPGNVAARHRVATSVAKALKGAGFSQGEVGYNQLLYPNEKDVRRLLSWAVQRLPRVDTGAGVGGEGKAATPLAHILLSVSAWMQPKWVPAPATSGGSTNAAAAAAASSTFAPLEALQAKCGCTATAASTKSGKAVREAALAALRASALEASPEHSSSSSLPLPPRVGARLALGDPSSLSTLPPFPLPTWEDLLLAAPSPTHGGQGGPRHFPGTHLDALPTAFNRRAAFAIKVERRAGGAPLPSSPTPDTSVARMRTEEEIARDREEEIAALTARLEAAGKDTEALGSQRAALAAALPPLAASLAAAMETLGGLERGYTLRSTCLAMLPEAASHLERLGREVSERGAALAALAGEWEGVRGGMAAAIRGEEEAAAAAAAKLEEYMGELGRLRGEMAGMAAAAAAKEEAVGRMEAELGRLQQAQAAAGEGGGGPPPSRTAFNSQIMAGLAGVRKQKGEVSRIVGDVKALQLELAAVGDGLKRIAGVALESMERAAKDNIKDPNYREAFKQILALQDLFAELINCATNSGAAANEARDLDNRIAGMLQRNDAAALAAVERDLAAVKAENASLQ